MSEAFRNSVFLTLSGGFQDAYTYIGRGKVFANAQTGNIVLLATNLCESDPRGSRVRTEWVAVDNQPTQLCTMHTGGMMLDYTRDYFAKFPDIVAEDSDYVHWGSDIGGDDTATPPGWGFGWNDDDTGDLPGDDTGDLPGDLPGD